MGIICALCSRIIGEGQVHSPNDAALCVSGYIISAMQTFLPCHAYISDVFLCTCICLGLHFVNWAVIDIRVRLWCGAAPSESV